MDVNKELINQWKIRYGSIFRIILEGNVIYFRNLSIKEFIVYSESNDKKLIPKFVILNDVEVTLPGSIEKLAEKALAPYSIDTEEEIVAKINLEKEKIESNLLYKMVIEICSLFPYTPDELMVKSVDEILRLMAFVSIVKKPNPKGPPSKMPEVRNDRKFKPPDTQELMNEAADELAQRMYMETGKKPKEFKKQGIVNANPSAIQMDEFNEFIK